MNVKRKVLLLLIEILIVTLALSLTVVTYAWYTANLRVETANTEVRAAAGAGTEIVAETDPSFDTYMGQDGTDNGDNAPYYVTKEMRVSFTPISAESAVQLNFVSISIAKAKGGGDDSSSDETVIPSFTWRLTYGGVEYRPDENGFAYYEDAEGDRTYISVSSPMTVDLVFKLIYLDEESYRKYQSGLYAEITPFRYSDYSYMRAAFTVLFEIGVDRLVIEEEGA